MKKIDERERKRDDGGVPKCPNCQAMMRLDFGPHKKGTIQYRCPKCGTIKKQPMRRYENVAVKQ